MVTCENISVRSATRSTGLLRKCRSTSETSCCSFGQGNIESLRLTPLSLAAEAYTILTLVVSLCSLSTGNKVDTDLEYHQFLLAPSFERNPWLYLLPSTASISQQRPASSLRVSQDIREGPRQSSCCDTMAVHRPSTKLPLHSAPQPNT